MRIDSLIKLTGSSISPALPNVLNTPKIDGPLTYGSLPLRLAKPSGKNISLLNHYWLYKIIYNYYVKEIYPC